ncbi:site-specific recombinase XerD [Virgibacillus halotolerans]|uniref:tyrosine-type recombinase/integrase n=1 Tax=Virgibacillus halotolerans TaxID=1071053 RepID=UPI001961C31F|nr:site-specific integrase [Virgibacillus halotolerans]MBM7598085.1 site-specific recombinase XerD [Virgibacillus halotolerans]
MSKEIEKNMLRQRAKKMPVVTDEMWKEVNQEYREFVGEYLSAQNHSPQTRKQYTSGLRHFGYFLLNSLNNKPMHELTKRDMLRYMSFLKDRGMSSSGINFKKACVSSLMNYIENFIADEVKTYSSFRNLTRGLPAIPKNQVYEKIKVTYDEYKEMMDILEKDKNYLGMAWLATAFNVGARRSEIIQFKTSILKDPFPEDKSFIMSHNVRLKGSGEDGKIEPYMIDKEAYDYMKLWVEKRGYESDYIFTTKHNGVFGQMSSSWADYFCSENLSYILNRRINPHLFKASCITYLLEQGVKLEMVSKYIAHHSDVSTTIQHYDLRDFEEERNNIFG